MIQNLPKSRLLGALTLSMVASSAAAQSVLSQYGETVHAAGDGIPPAAAGVTPTGPGAIIQATSTNFDGAVIDQNGTIVYRAKMLNGGTTGADDRALFMGRTAADLQMVVRAGDQAPGLAPGILLRSSSATTGSAGLCGSGGPVRISPFGEFLLFQSTLHDPITPANTPTTADTALFWGPVGGITALAIEGQPVPVSISANGELFGNLSMSMQNTCMNGSGTALFTTTMTGGLPVVTAANDAAMIVGTPGNLTLVQREGEVLGSGEIVILSGGFLANVNQINEAGEVLYELRFSTTLPSTATTANDRALAIWSPISGRTIIAREGDTAPGLGNPDIKFATSTNGWFADTIGGAAFTKSGKTAMNTNLWDFVGATVTTANDTAVYVGGTSGWTLIKREGDPCVGLPGGGNWGSANNSSLTCNDAGQVAFVEALQAGSGGVTTLNDTSIWAGSAGNLTMIAREGDQVPSLPANHAWAQLNGGTNSPHMNARGHVVFQGSYWDNNVSPAIFYSGLFGWTPELGIVNLLQWGDNFTSTLGVAPWTGLSPTTNNSGDGGSLHFNNNGDFVYRVLSQNVLPTPSLFGLIVRGHLGSLIGEPSAVPVGGGVPHEFHLDVGPTYGNQFYFILASGLGTRPGFPHPLNFGINVPLNYDSVWTAVSQAWVNTALWTNTLFVTDGTGKPLGNPTIQFNMPPGYPGFQGLTIHHSALLFDGALMGTFATEPVAVKLY